MGRILITGGAGFIGHNTALMALEMGHDVHILDNLSKICRKLLVVVPLGDNSIYRIDAYHLDKTHIIAENEKWWINLSW